MKPAAEDAKQEEQAAQPGVSLPAQAEGSNAASASQPAPVQPPAAQPQPVAQQPPAPSGGNNNNSGGSGGGSGALPAGVSEESVSTLVAITNKPRDLCIQALQMTQGNADLACSILLEGINPAELQAMA